MIRQETDWEKYFCKAFKRILKIMDFKGKEGGNGASKWLYLIGCHHLFPKIVKISPSMSASESDNNLLQSKFLDK